MYEYTLKPQVRFRVVNDAELGDDTNVIPLRTVQKQLLEEIKKPDCNEGILEYEALDILFALRKNEFVTTDLPSQPTK